MDQEWHHDFFEGLIVELWAKAVPPELTRAEVDFLQRTLGLQPGSAVLDVPCGAGRHCIELASRGCRMTGVDGSAEMLALARAAAESAGLDIEWRHGDMRDLPWQSRFDAAYCFGNSFGYLNPDGTRAFLQSVAAALKPGARFAFDYGLAAESILPHLKDREWCQIQDILFLEENRYDLDAGCVETQYTLIKDGRITRRRGLHWVYSLRELRGFLAEAGLRVCGMFGSPAGDPFRPGVTLVMVTEKG
ncbi:MAG: class I SAM-dependent methyltransferase [Acidobacteriota bacterium]